MRDTLPNTPNHVEYGILNLDSIQNTGTHWTLWYKNENDCFYFDSFGMDPPEEFKSYIRPLPIICSTFRIQETGTNICGHLCLLLLSLLESGLTFEEAVLQVVNE
jgi:hypothetical protein